MLDLLCLRSSRYKYSASAINYLLVFFNTDLKSKTDVSKHLVSFFFFERYIYVYVYVSDDSLLVWVSGDSLISLFICALLACLLPFSHSPLFALNRQKV